MAPTLQQRFGRAVARLRREAGYSQEAFARVAHLDRSYMGQIERGRTNITLDIVGRIAKALDISLIDLFSAVEEE